MTQTAVLVRFYIVGLVIMMYMGFSSIFVSWAQSNENDSYSIISRRFIPEVYYVGDIVELNVQIRVTKNLHKRLQALDNAIIIEYAQVRWSDIQKINFNYIENNDYQLTIIYTSFMTGINVLPVITLRHHISDDTIRKTTENILLRISGIETTTYSILEQFSQRQETQDFARIDSMLLVPGTEIFVTLCLLLLLGLPIVLYIVLQYCFFIMRYVLIRYKAYYLLHMLLKRHTQLLAICAEISVQEFYHRLEDSVREYFFHRFKINAYSYTYSELKDYVDTTFATHFITPIGEIFSHSAHARFSTQAFYTIEQRIAHVKSINETIQTIDAYQYEKERHAWQEMIRNHNWFYKHRKSIQKVSS